MDSYQRQENHPVTHLLMISLEKLRTVLFLTMKNTSEFLQYLIDVSYFAGHECDSSFNK